LSKKNLAKRLNQEFQRIPENDEMISARALKKKNSLIGKLGCEFPNIFRVLSN
jgi:hypothetical protein